MKRLPEGIHKRLRLVSQALSSYYRLETESIIELLARALELKAKSVRKSLKIKYGGNKISKIWKGLYQEGLITKELFIVVDTLRHIRNLLVHGEQSGDPKSLEKLLLATNHILALDWAAELFGNPHEFIHNATNTWEIEKGLNLLLPFLEPCPACKTKNFPGYRCRNQHCSIYKVTD